jgi:transcription initiation factor TFIIIB Brf1 subunit/transcription initiation factor TFIIB
MRNYDKTVRICSHCHVKKPISEYHKNSWYCKACKSIISHEWMDSHKEQLKVKRKIYRDNHREQAKYYAREYWKINGNELNKRKRDRYKLTNGEKDKLYYNKNRAKILQNFIKYRLSHKDYFKKRYQDYYNKNRDSILENKRLYAISVKEEVLTHYGNGTLKCVKCGCVDLRTLSIDHINGGGCKHRKDKRIAYSTSFYEWLKKQGYPSGFQTLCMNCQFIKRSENKEYPIKTRGK